MSKMQKEKIPAESIRFEVDDRWSVVKPINVISDNPEEKAYALNKFLNEYYFSKFEKPYTTENYVRKYANMRYSEHLYKYRMLFDGQKESKFASYASFHSILANLVIDYPKVENENEVVTSLRENWHIIREFGTDKMQNECRVLNCDLKYQRHYKDMLKHILISDANLPKCINVNSLRKVGEDLTYAINKK